MEDIETVEDIVPAEVFRDEIETVHRLMAGEFARRRLGKNSNALRLLC